MLGDETHRSWTDANGNVTLQAKSSDGSGTIIDLIADAVTKALEVTGHVIVDNMSGTVVPTSIKIQDGATTQLAVVDGTGDLQTDVNNFPAGFNVNNFPATQTVAVSGVTPVLGEIPVAPGLVTRSVFDFTGSPDGSTPVYIGTNLQTALVADTTWVVKKFFFDGSNRVTDIQVITGSWTGRASLAWRTAGGD